MCALAHPIARGRRSHLQLGTAPIASSLASTLVHFFSSGEIAMTFAKVRRIGLALLIASTGALAACSSDDSTTSGGTSGGADAAPAQKDIVDTAVAAGSFTTLAKALTAADLVTTLKGAGPFTVFAPTDAAFAKLPAGTLDTLLKPENKAMLVDILTYHVIAGNVKAADVVKLTSATTVEGKTVKITVQGGKVVLNDASNVTATDIGCTNGTIHVIDAVLLPPTM
jgi:uncharacterized surface protein with fasciclin (FAS1) repeats